MCVCLLLVLGTWLLRLGATFTVTLRYHSLDAPGTLPHAISGRSDALDICGRYPAVCLDLQINRCVAAPAGSQRTPQMIRFEEGRLNSSQPDWASHDGVPGGFLLLTMNSFSDGSQHAVLWSGCSQGCLGCRALTGFALPLVGVPEMNVCSATAEGSVYAFVVHRETYTAFDPHQSCLSDSGITRRREHEQPQPPRDDPTSTISILVVSCVVLTIIFTAYFMLKLFGPYTQRTVQVEQPEDGRVAAIGAMDPASVIGKAQIDPLFPTTTATGNPTCIICLLQIGGEEPARALQCTHIFHDECIVTWWTHKPRATLECPMCRRTQSLQTAEELG